LDVASPVIRYNLQEILMRSPHIEEFKIALPLSVLIIKPNNCWRIIKKRPQDCRSGHELELEVKTKMN
jgi:hypothetical protein